MLDIIFRGGGQNHAKYYRFHVNESQQTHGDALKFLGKSSRTLSWWCFNPGLAMEEFLKLGVRSIILTSGTLSPLDSLAMELNLFADICAHFIVNFARIVPDGLLVFFPSYSMMDMCVDFWKNRNHSNSASENTIWQRICKHKQPVIEPRQSSNFQSAIELDDLGLCHSTFQLSTCVAAQEPPVFSRAGARLEDKPQQSGPWAWTSGRVWGFTGFMAASHSLEGVEMRSDWIQMGRFSFYKSWLIVSEGLDFADRAGRAVIVTGMPFATPTDAKVRLKREYLDKQGTPSNKNTKMLTGEEWYVQQAARAVNQAVGRVIRHRHDYGAIIYCDERFVWPNYQSQMSYWLRPHIKCYSKYGEVVQGLTRFFRDKASSDPLTLEPTDCNTYVLAGILMLVDVKFFLEVPGDKGIVDSLGHQIDDPVGFTPPRHGESASASLQSKCHL
ncbi:Regulator of telomere elongation helicase 1 [Zea mays]|nr:Regulator of telomere elongation helicase 1 [Zea mays]